MFFCFGDFEICSADLFRFQWHAVWSRDDQQRGKPTPNVVPLGRAPSSVVRASFGAFGRVATIRRSAAHGRPLPSGLDHVDYLKTVTVATARDKALLKRLLVAVMDRTPGMQQPPAMFLFFGTADVLVHWLQLKELDTDDILSTLWKLRLHEPRTDLLFVRTVIGTIMAAFMVKKKKKNEKRTTEKT